MPLYSLCFDSLMKRIPWLDWPPPSSPISQPLSKGAILGSNGT